METVISRGDTAFLKGMSILAIVLHNFCHWIPGCVVENEYCFEFGNTLHLFSAVCDGGPHVVLNLFSYFGWYGVPVFLFISGYGLARKHEGTGGKGCAPEGVWSFFTRNAFKLWQLMLVGVALLYVYEAFLTTGWRHGFMNVVWLFSFLTNFFPQSDTAFLPRQDLLLGPWWYFSLTMQVYMLYRLWWYGRGRAAVAGAAAVCVAAQALAVTVFADSAQTMLHYLRYTFLGHTLPFALGVWAARYGLGITWKIYTVAVVVFALSLFNVFAWILATAALAVMAIPLARVRAAWIRKPFEWLGGISAALFVLHPVARCFFNPRHSDNVYPTLALYLSASIVAAWLLTKLMAYLSKNKL